MTPSGMRFTDTTDGLRDAGSVRRFGASRHGRSSSPVTLSPCSAIRYRYAFVNPVRVGVRQCLKRTDHFSFRSLRDQPARIGPHCWKTWYRAQLRERIPAIIGTWEPVMGVSVAEWGVKRMKTRWGSCNPGARRIWLSLELARRPLYCLEYVVVHEMVHLLERGHNWRFYSFMDQFLPDWRHARAVLRDSPPG